jgi:hypothetical protein
MSIRLVHDSASAAADARTEELWAAHQAARRVLEAAVGAGDWHIEHARAVATTYDAWFAHFNRGKA